VRRHVWPRALPSGQESHWEPPEGHSGWHWSGSKLDRVEDVMAKLFGVASQSSTAVAGAELEARGPSDAISPVGDRLTSQ
jgi:hypothetical protein